MTLNAHKTREFSATNLRATNLSSILCVEIAINPIVIPIHANKNTFQRRCQFALIVTDHPVVPSDTFPIYVSYIKFAKNALAKTKSPNIASVMFVSTKSEYSRVLTHVTNSVNGCFIEDNEETRIFCHNFRGYDSYPIVSYMYENAILPEVTMNGSKFMSIEVRHLKMKFIDSLNFIPMALSKIPKVFNLSELAKGYFPHLFNKCENQKIILNRLPDINYYHPGGMMP